MTREIATRFSSQAGVDTVFDFVEMEADVRSSLL